MKKLIISVLLLSAWLFADVGYHENRILFCLQKDIPQLHIEMQNGIAQTNLPGLNRLLQKYQVTELRKWLRSADDNDVVGEVNLNKVYRATLKTKHSWNELQQMRTEFAAVTELHSADLESINHIRTVPQAVPYVPDDSRFGEQWFIDKIQANYVWGMWDGTPGDPTVLVGVVDTGVDTQHPDLQGVLYLNPGEDLNSNGVVDASDQNGVDDDGNGYVDDFYGYDFADNDTDIRPPDAGPDQELSHGTHCTGIIAASTDNATGVSGISFRSKVIASKHAYDTDTTTPSIVEGYDGILYCAKLGAQFINCSWGGSYLFSYEKNILDDVSDNYGAIVVGAAGNDDHDNDTTPQYPSDYAKCISVAATTTSDHKAYYSNWGSAIDISAPAGEGSSSTSATLSTIHDNAGSYAAWQGTSMAAPMVVGAFALLKAWFPSASRQWLWDELLNNADPIDDLNPSYSGQLGGRLNIYNAISRNTFPYLTVSDFSVSVIADNGNGELNPGENANLVLTLANDPLWQDANDVAVSISSSDPSVTIVDGSALLGNIAAGASATSGATDLEIAISADAKIGSVPITVDYSANASSAHPYSWSQDISVDVSMNQVGFPVTKIGFITPLATANILGDAKEEIIGVGDDDSVYVYSSDGTLASGFPIYMGAYTSMAPAVGDVDNDGQQEIVICERVNGYLKIIKGDGSFLLEQTIGAQIQGEISLANMDSDPDLEIIFGTYSEKKVHVLNYDGSYVAGFPTAAYPSLINQNIAVADVNNDGANELVFGLFNTDLYVIDNTGATLTNFPVDLSSRLSTSPVVADIKNDGIYIIAPEVNKKIQIVDMTGTFTSEYTAYGVVQSTPALADFNGNGSLDILFGTDASTINVINFAGDTLAPFPLTVSADILTSPVVADLDNNGTLEMLVSSEGGYIYALEADGSDYKNFPANIGGALSGSGCVSDIDGDNDYEFIVGGSNGLNVIDLTDVMGSGSGLWQTYHANNQRTAYQYFDPTPSALSSDTGPLKQFALHQNYPNPFNPQTRISYRLAEKSRVQLDVFNLLGQKVVTLVNASQEVGLHHVTLDGSGLSSGVYVYRMVYRTASGKNGTFHKKLLLLR